MTSKTETKPGAHSGEVNLARILNEADAKDDAVYFAAHPGRTFRLRPSSLLEQIEAEAPFTLVCKTGPKSRTRLLINLDLPEVVDCDAFSDAQLMELFQYVQGIGGGVN